MDENYNQPVKERKEMKVGMWHEMFITVQDDAKCTTDDEKFAYDWLYVIVCLS